MIVERLERTIERSTAASSATVTKGRDDEGSRGVKLCPRSDATDSAVPHPCDPSAYLRYLVFLSIESSSELTDFLPPMHIHVHRPVIESDQNRSYLPPKLLSGETIVIVDRLGALRPFNAVVNAVRKT